jgi:Rrf2 family protein
VRTNTQFAIAIHILTLLALAGGAQVTSTEMAGSVNTNPAFLRRILGDLHRAGLVESQPGVSGGWRLCCEPGAITLLAIFLAVGERHLLAMHHHPNPNCQIGGVIQSTLETYFGEAEAAFEQTLAAQTLAQVVVTALATAAREAS